MAAGNSPDSASARSRFSPGKIVVIFGQMEGVHFQIGRTYPLEERSDPAAWQVLKAVKRAVDPDRRMNPGVLGL